MLALQFYLWTLRKTSFITVADTKMQYMATNTRHNLGFYLQWDDLTALGGVQLGQIILGSRHPYRAHVIFIHILKGNNPKKSVLYSVRVLPRAT